MRHQLTYRSKRIRQQGQAFTDANPEVLPSAPLQSLLNSASMQGGGEVRLGPYTYKVISTVTVPSNVTLVGVPTRTKIIKEYVSGETSTGSWGPVLKLNGSARVVDCVIDLILGGSNTLVTDNYHTIGSLQEVSVTTGTKFYPGDGSSYDAASEDNSVVVLAGERARIERCYVPEGRRRAILITLDDGIVIGNEIEDDTIAFNPCVYLDNGVDGCVVTSNWCRDSDNGVISVQSGQPNAIEANYGIKIERA